MRELHLEIIGAETQLAKAQQDLVYEEAPIQGKHLDLLATASSQLQDDEALVFKTLLAKVAK
eukprot:8889846-Karenia_brevis.AAC.1